MTNIVPNPLIGRPTGDVRGDRKVQRIVLSRVSAAQRSPPSRRLHGRCAFLSEIPRVAPSALLRRLRCEGRIENPRAAEQYLRLRLAGLPHEELHAVWLDAQRRVITCDGLAKGAVDRAKVDMRRVVRVALDRNAAAVILAHNHPGGVAQPSREDVAFTSRLRAALAFVEGALSAHFVVGEGATVRVR